jgi:hypothetical protein
MKRINTNTNISNGSLSRSNLITHIFQITYYFVTPSSVQASGDKSNTRKQDDIPSAN